MRKKISALLVITFCLSLLSMPLWAATKLTVPIGSESTVPQYETPGGRATFILETDVIESKYCNVDWYQVGENGADDIFIETHKYTGTCPETWHMKDTFVTPTMDKTHEYYGVVHDFITDKMGLRTVTNTVRSNVLYNVKDFNIHSGYPTKFTSTTSPDPESVGLVTQKQWMWSNQGKEFVRVDGATDDRIVRPLQSASQNNGDRYYLRNYLFNNTYVDAKPVTLTVLKPYKMTLKQGPGVIHDGLKLTTSLVRGTLYYEDGTTDLASEDWGTMVFTPDIAKAGTHTYHAVYTNLVGDVNEADVEITADVPEGMITDNKEIMELSANYVGVGDEINHPWDNDNFAVYARFRDLDGWYKWEDFTVNPGKVKVIGDNDLIITVNHGFKAITTDCVGIGIDSNDKNCNGIDDDTIVDLKVSYDDPYIIHGNKHDPNKVHVIAVPDLGEEHELNKSEYTINPKPGDTLYDIFATHGSVTRSVSVPYRASEPIGISAEYHGSVAVGAHPDPKNFTVWLEFSDGTKAETEVYRVEDIEIHKGRNDVHVYVNKFSTVATIIGILLDDMGINPPTIVLEAVNNDAEAEAIVGDALEEMGLPLMTGKAIQMELIDNKTTTDQSTDRYYSINGSNDTHYDSRVIIAAEPGIYRVVSYAKYMSLKSDNVDKYVSLTSSGDLVDTEIEGLRATYTGGTVDVGGSIDIDYLNVELLFKGTDQTIPVEKKYLQVDDYTIKEGENTLTVHAEGHSADFTVIGFKADEHDKVNDDKIAQKIKAEPVNPTVTAGLKPNNNMFKVTIAYDDGTSKKTSEFTIDSPDVIALGLNDVVIRYNGLFANCTITGVEGVIEQEYVDNTPEPKITVYEEEPEPEKPKAPETVFRTTRYEELAELDVEEITDEKIKELEPSDKKLVHFDDMVVSMLPAVGKASGVSGLRPWIYFTAAVIIAVLIVLGVLAIIFAHSGKLGALFAAADKTSRLKIVNAYIENSVLYTVIENIYNPPVTITIDIVGNVSTDSQVITQEIEPANNKTTYVHEQHIDISKVDNITISIKDKKGYQPESKNIKCNA